MKKRYILAPLVVAILCAPALASAATADELRAQIQALLTQVTALQAELERVTSSAPASSVGFCPALYRPLSRGANGSDVASLQQFLITQGFLGGDSATGYFGPLTESAVQRWQAQNAIISFGDPSTGYGVVGPRTRAAIAARCGEIKSFSVPGTTRPEGSLSASPKKGDAPLRVVFSIPDTCTAGIASEDVRRIVFGDGETESLSACGVQSVTHRYTSAGSYTASLQIAGYGPAPLTWRTHSKTSINVSNTGGETSGTPSIRVVSPNGGETLSAGTVEKIRWEASNIPATAYVGGSEVSYKIGLQLVGPGGNLVGYIPLNSELFEGTARSAQWDPSSLNGGFSPVSQLKVRASVIKQTNKCAGAAAVNMSLATSQAACITEETVVSDDSDDWFAAKGVIVCNTSTSPMTCTES